MISTEKGQEVVVLCIMYRYTGTVKIKVPRAAYDEFVESAKDRLAAWISIEDESGRVAHFNAEEALCAIYAEDAEGGGKESLQEMPEAGCKRC